ncbi:MAG: hypothetical protein QXP60_03700 [Nitrososphaerota archaeon]
MEKEYEIEIIERDPNKKYLIVRINKEELKIEKIPNEEIEKCKEILKEKDKKGKNKYDIIIERIDIFNDPNNVYRYYFPNIKDKMLYYFGNKNEFIKLRVIPFSGHFLKYKENYFFVYNKDGAISINWISIVPIDIFEDYYGTGKKAIKIRKEYGPNDDICEEFKSIIKYIVTPKYDEIKIIKKDPNEKYLIAEINKEEVKIDKVSKEEIEEWKRNVGHKYQILMEEIKKIKLYSDKEIAYHQYSCADSRIGYYFGSEHRFELKDKHLYGHFLKYKENYFYIHFSWEEYNGKEIYYITIKWIFLIPIEIYNKYKNEIDKIKRRYMPSKNIKEFLSIIEYIMFPKYKIEVIDNDREKGYVIVKINGEEVKIEKVPNEEMEELRKKYEIQEWPKWADKILFKEKDLKREKSLAIYRLMLYIGNPNEIMSNERCCCYYHLKYKGHYFSLSDEIFDYIWIQWCRLIPKDIYLKYSHGNEEAAKIIREFEPPKDIYEEFSAIIEYLVRNPCMIRIEGGNVPF